MGKKPHSPSVLNCPECGKKLIPDNVKRTARCGHKGGCKKTFTYGELFSRFFNKAEATPKGEAS